MGERLNYRQMDTSNQRYCLNKLDPMIADLDNERLREQLDDQGLEGAVLGRSPYRDPNLPAIRDRTSLPDEGAVDAD
jgi:hypothetical protein